MALEKHLTWPGHVSRRQVKQEIHEAAVVEHSALLEVDAFLKSVSAP
jgi:hypothetical protein